MTPERPSTYQVTRTRVKASDLQHLEVSHWLWEALLCEVHQEMVKRGRREGKFSVFSERRMVSRVCLSEKCRKKLVNYYCKILFHEQISKVARICNSTTHSLDCMLSIYSQHISSIFFFFSYLTAWRQKFLYIYVFGVIQRSTTFCSRREKARNLKHLYKVETNFLKKSATANTLPPPSPHPPSSLKNFSPSWTLATSTCDFSLKLRFF